jgi:hypothetical protein
VAAVLIQWLRLGLVSHDKVFDIQQAQYGARNITCDTMMAMALED